MGYAPFCSVPLGCHWGWGWEWKMRKGNGDGDGVLNFSLLYRQLWLQAFRRRRAGSMTPTTGGLPARVTRTCVYIWLMWFYFCSHYPGVEWAVLTRNRDQAAGHQAPGVSLGLSRSSSQKRLPTHTLKLDKTEKLFHGVCVCVYFA